MPDDNTHERSNRGQSALIVCAMFALLGITGFAIWGVPGVFVSILVAIFLVYSSGRASPALVLKMYKAQEIQRGSAPELEVLFDRLVEKAQLQYKPRLYYVPSKMMNAFAMGRNEHAVVAVTHGLLKKMNNEEIGGVIAHELSHIKHRDLWVMGLADVFSRMTTIMGQVGQVMLLFSLPAMLFGMQVPIPLAAVLVLVLAPMASSLLQLALSRSREYEADFGAAQITGNPAGLASALRKIEQANTSWVQKVLFPGRKIPEPALLRTHPPTEERIKRLPAMRNQTLPPVMEMPVAVVHAPDLRRVLRRPRWHLMSGLWY